MQCEICGQPIRSTPQTVRIDESVLRVCPSCARVGTPSQVSRKPGPPAPRPRPKPHYNLAPQEETELRMDFHTIIKRARERLGLSQEELGLRINEKPSVIRLLEVGKLKPNDSLARKMENYLKIELLVPSEGDL